MANINERQIDEALFQFLTGIQNDMKSVMSQENMNATGKTQSLFSVQVKAKKGILYGAGHIQTLESGRGPTRSSGGSGGQSLYQKILEWVRAKGVSFGGYKDTQVAGMITSVIHREGTLRYRTKQPSGILSNTLTDQRFDNFFKTVSDGVFNELFSNVVKTIPKI